MQPLGQPAQTRTRDWKASALPRVSEPQVSLRPEHAITTGSTEYVPLLCHFSLDSNGPSAQQSAEVVKANTVMRQAIRRGSTA